MKKILVFGAYDYNNLGDDLMMYAVSNNLRKQKIKPYFIHTEDRNYFEFKREYDDTLFLGQRHKNSFINKTSQYLSLVKFSKNNLNKYDSLVFMGGGYINRIIGSGYGRLLYMYLLKRLFTKKKKPVYFTGQTIGPVGGRLEKWIVKKIMKGCAVYTREQRSFKYLSSIGINNFLSGDDAYLLLDKIATKSNNAGNSKKIVVNFKDFDGYEPLFDCFCAMIYEIALKTKMNVIFIPFRNNQEMREYSLHEKMTRYLIGKGIKATFVCPKKIEDVIDIYEKSDIVISTAYHSAIMGLMCNKPVFTGYIGDYYRTKIVGATNRYDAICKVYNLEEESSFKRMAKDVLAASAGKDVRKINASIASKVNAAWAKIAEEMKNINEK